MKNTILSLLQSSWAHLSVAHIPFIMAVDNGRGGKQAIFAWRELVTALIIALVTAASGAYWTVRETKIEVGYLKEYVQRLEKVETDRIEKIENDCGKIRDQFNDHRAKIERTK